MESMGWGGFGVGEPLRGDPIAGPPCGVGGRCGSAGGRWALLRGEWCGVGAALRLWSRWGGGDLGWGDLEWLGLGWGGVWGGGCCGVMGGGPSAYGFWVGSGIWGGVFYGALMGYPHPMALEPMWWLGLGWGGIGGGGCCGAMGPMGVMGVMGPSTYRFWMGSGIWGGVFYGTLMGYRHPMALEPMRWLGFGWEWDLGWGLL